MVKPWDAKVFEKNTTYCKRYQFIDLCLYRWRFFSKCILTLQPNGEPLTFAFFFIFWGMYQIKKGSNLNCYQSRQIGYPLCQYKDNKLCWYKNTQRGLCKGVVNGICKYWIIDNDFMEWATRLLWILRWLMEWRCNGVEGSGADASSDPRNGMHRNGRSDRKHIWFPFAECLCYAVWGKCMTEWNEKNYFGAWSGLSRCILALALFYSNLFYF